MNLSGLINGGRRCFSAMGLTVLEEWQYVSTNVRGKSSFIKMMEVGTG